MKKILLFGVVLFLTVMMSYGKDFYNLNYIRKNNVILNENLACTIYTISSVTATPSCASDKTSSVTISSSAAGLPIDTYTVTYSLGYNGNSTSYTASMNVTTPGTGNFTANLGIVNLTSSSTVRIDRITSTTSSCFSNITSNNVSNSSYMHAALTAPTVANGSSQCDRKWLAQWTPNSTRDGYYLDVAIDASFTNFFTGYENKYISGGNTSSEVISNLAYGGTYYYRLRTKTYCGTSASSNTITIDILGDGSSNPGTISGGAPTVCVGANTPAFLISGSSPNGQWSIFNQTGSASITTGGIVTGVSPGTVYVVYTTKNIGNTCGTSRRQTLTITGGTVSAASSTPTVCANTAITSITHNTSGFTGIGTPTNLPTGLTASFASNVVTISGTPTVSGIFTYTIPLTGGSCGGANATGTITVRPTLSNNNLTYGTSVQVNNTATESNNMVLNAASGSYFYTVNFASYGTPAGTAPSFTIGSCHSATSQTVTEGYLLGNNTATIPATNGIFGDPCNGITKSLYVSATYAQPVCSGSSVTITGSTPTGGNGTYTYEWQSSTTGATGSFTPISGTNTINYTSGALTQNTYFRRVVTSCTYSSTSAVVLVKLNPAILNNVLSYNSGTSGQLNATPVENASAIFNAPTGTYFATVNFASYGSSTGTAPNFTIGSCHSATSQTVTEGYLLGNSNATIPATNGVFGDPCSGTTKSLYVLASYAQAVCKGSTASITGTTPTGGNGTYTYEWQSSTSATSGFVIATGVSNGKDYTSGVLTQTTYFRRVVTSCSSTSISPIVMVKLSVTNIWNGTAWSDGGNPPTLEQNVEFNGNFNSIADVNGCSCQVNNGRTVVFKSVGTNSGHILKITNEVTVLGSGTLTFENNASLIQTNDAAPANSGNIKYHRHTAPVKRYDYTYWSSPVVGQTLYNLSPNTLGDKYYSYDPDLGWQISYDGIDIMAKGRGYIIRAPQYFDTNTAEVDINPVFIGTPNNGVITLPSLAVNRVHLLGNPYPSAIDAEAFIDFNSSVLEGTLYFWTHNSPPVSSGSTTYSYTVNDYATYNKTGSVITKKAAITGITVPTGKIAAGQGFFAPVKLTGDVIFNNAMRTSGGVSGTDNSQFFKLSTNSKTSTTAVREKNRVWLNLTNKEGAFKQTLIGYITGATNDYDGGFDGVTYDANPFVDFYSVNNQVNLVIQGRALPFVKIDSVALGYKSTIQGEFQISIDHTDGALATQKIFLEDQDLKVLHDLKKEPYTFNTEKGVFNNRFVLRYVDKNAIEVELSKEVIVSVLDKKITINSALTTIDKVVLYDMTGRKLFQKNKADANVFVIPNFVWNHQVLVVDVILSDGTKHTRKVVN